ncbi:MULTISPECIES: NADPH-dependent FMN reductase [Bacillaceae]|uniref:NAD(P)H-dependent oxidoreductase n=1 Tax=Evansella alkalicola TaxID=745819 RepID=A0ABS6K0B0_9BACI|nr:MULTISPECIES: NAD(P)H-dependent oxidoreductase [Bacillaceae]MBU9723766.1 NAD(P)H-dependent oxidoreductase [Bacillus alkalicola]
MIGNTKHSIILINGSMNRESFTKKLLDKMAVQLNENGSAAKILNVRDLQLPIFAPDLDTPNQLEKVSQDLKNADGVIVGSPEYHGSYTGALKNFLDFLGFEEFQNTPIGLVTTTGGVKSGTNTVNHLRLVFRNLHGLVIPQQFAISKKDTNSDLQLDEQFQIRLEKFLNDLEREVKKKKLLEAMENSEL